MMGVQLLGVVDEGGGGDDPKPDPKPADPKPDPKPADPKPSDSEAKLLRELMEKKGALKDTNSELTQVKEQLAKFDGIDLEEVSALLKGRKDAETAELEKKGEWDRLKVDLVELHTTEKTTLQAQIDELAAKLLGSEQSINKLTVGSAFEASKYIAEELTLTPNKAKVIYGNHFDFEGNGIIGYDKPKGSADRTMLIDANGDPLSFDAAMTSIIAKDIDRDHLVRAKVKPGADSGNEDGDIIPTKVAAKGRGRISAALNASA